MFRDSCSSPRWAQPLTDDHLWSGNMLGREGGDWNVAQGVLPADTLSRRLQATVPAFLTHCAGEALRGRWDTW
jgi:hypothetical protein